MGAKMALISFVLAATSVGCQVTAPSLPPSPENPAIVVDDPACVSCGWLLDAAELSQFQQRADAGDSEAAFRIALHYSSADDPQQSNSWMRRAGQSGHGIAQYNLWFGLREPGNCADRLEALSWLEKSAAQGVSQAAEQLQLFNQVVAPCKVPPNNSFKPTPLRGAA